MASVTSNYSNIIKTYNGYPNKLFTRLKREKTPLIDFLHEVGLEQMTHEVIIKFIDVLCIKVVEDYQLDSIKVLKLKSRLQILFSNNDKIICFCTGKLYKRTRIPIADMNNEYVKRLILNDCDISDDDFCKRLSNKSDEICVLHGITNFENILHWYSRAIRPIFKNIVIRCEDLTDEEKHKFKSTMDWILDAGSFRYYE